MSQFADADSVSPSVKNIGNIGDGNKSGSQFQDSDDMYTLKGFNVITPDDDDYAGKASGATWSRISVDNSVANRGRES
jgi:hypothetical protein